VPEPKAPKQAGSDIARAALALSNLQMVRRDFAFEVESPIPAADIVRAARGADKKLITSVRVFDVFEGGQLTEGMKSVGLEVSLQPTQATLTDAKIEAVCEKVTAAVVKATGGRLRG
jgi:phenylalanyl-tRNA synthetase beta chain